MRERGLQALVEVRAQIALEHLAKRSSIGYTEELWMLYRQSIVVTVYFHESAFWCIRSGMFRNICRLSRKNMLEVIICFLPGPEFTLDHCRISITARLANINSFIYITRHRPNGAMGINNSRILTCNAYNRYSYRQKINETSPFNVGNL